MTKGTKGVLSLLLAAVLTLCCPAAVFAAGPEDTLAGVTADTAQYLYETVQTPQVGSIGGEWAVLGLARSDYGAPEQYYRDYYARVEAYVTAKDGVLHDKKYTEYARVIVALSAIGKDARDVAGYDLTRPLGDYEKTVWQGLNGPIWALIALDSRDYPMPQNPEAETQATRQMYVDYILERQLPEGGWNLLGSSDAPSDPDLTGMALQALAKYRDQPAVQAACEAALACMSGRQDASGGFPAEGAGGAESCAQMIVALCELGIPLDDPRFVKDGHTALDGLMDFYRPGGGFVHTGDGSGSNQMATEQAFYALVAVQRAQEGRGSLYRMDDALAIGEGGQSTGGGLANKHPDVQARPVTRPGMTFADVSGGNAHANQAAIESLAARGIVDGRDNGLFDPEATMTRAEFATMVVGALGLAPRVSDDFTDVPGDRWYAPYVGAAYAYGVVSGVGGGKFDPQGTITRQEAAVMVTRAAELCGLDTGLDAASVRDVLAQFPDYVSAAQWARAGLAFCYDSGILDDAALEIQPGLAIKRCEMAQMLFNLLDRADLLG